MSILRTAWSADYVICWLHDLQSLWSTDCQPWYFCDTFYLANPRWQRRMWNTMTKHDPGCVWQKEKSNSCFHRSDLTDHHSKPSPKRGKRAPLQDPGTEQPLGDKSSSPTSIFIGFSLVLSMLMSLYRKVKADNMLLREENNQPTRQNNKLRVHIAQLKTRKHENAFLIVHPIITKMYHFSAY